MTEPLKRILLVEDDPDVQTIASMALIDIGEFDLTVCSSGREALDRIGHIQPQLVLLDVMMPDMDGPTTLEALRRLPLTPQPPVVFMTAKVQPQEQRRYLDLGAVDVIAKPFDPVTLADQLHAVWARRLNGVA
ncbi:response regulator [Aliidongia dinghuensis]|uniref:Response regulator n=1 Tax=Aliidongia dinghuensis TaxID=1867774 RepID=A0A8J2YYZ8_9PROT|nr:response regulator [Aliidongia dinghuensis]GGF35510.1 response regulator [Aliidongia dinghuensis]